MGFAPTWLRQVSPPCFTKPLLPLEVHYVIKSLTNGKAPGADCIPPEVLKCGGMPLVHRSEHLFPLIWREEAAPQEFKDASIVHDASSDDSDVILDGRLFQTLGMVCMVLYSKFNVPLDTI